MKIEKAVIISTKHEISVVVSHKKKEFMLDIQMLDGHVIGDAENGVRTSYFTYFHEVPLKVRQKHFNQIRKYVENNLP